MKLFTIILFLACFTALGQPMQRNIMTTNQQVAAGSGIILSQSAGVATITSTGGGVAGVAPGNNVTTSTNLGVVTVNSSGGGGTVSITGGGGVSVVPSGVSSNFVISATGSSVGNLFIPIVPSNQVFSSSSFISPIINNGLQEATGIASDGTNVYVSYNDPTNGIGVYIETHSGLGLNPLGAVVASNYLYGNSGLLYNVAGGLSYYQGQLMVCVGYGFAPSSSNALIIFNTNCVLQAIHPLGQQPNFVQHFQQVSSSLAIACYFGSPEGAGNNAPFPAGHQLPYFTVGSQTTGTPWTTNGQYIPLSQPIDAEGFALDNGGTLWSYGVSVPITFVYPWNLLNPYLTGNGLGDGAQFEIATVNTNTGALTVVAYPDITNGIIVATGQTTGNCMFFTNNFSQLDVVVQGANAGGGYANPNTNYIVGFTTIAGTNNAQINSAGVAFIPYVAASNITAVGGQVTNVTVQGCPLFSVIGNSYLKGLVDLLPTAAGLDSANPCFENDGSGNFKSSVPSGNNYFFTVNNGNTFNISSSAVASVPVFQAYGGINNMPSLVGNVNSTASVSNVTVTNVSFTSNLLGGANSVSSVSNSFATNSQIQGTLNAANANVTNVNFYGTFTGNGTNASAGQVWTATDSSGHAAFAPVTGGGSGIPTLNGLGTNLSVAQSLTFTNAWETNIWGTAGNTNYQWTGATVETNIDGPTGTTNIVNGTTNIFLTNGVCYYIDSVSTNTIGPEGGTNTQSGSQGFLYGNPSSPGNIKWNGGFICSVGSPVGNFFPVFNGSTSGGLISSGISYITPLLKNLLIYGTSSNTAAPYLASSNGFYTTVGNGWTNGPFRSVFHIPFSYSSGSGTGWGVNCYVTNYTGVVGAAGITTNVTCMTMGASGLTALVQSGSNTFTGFVYSNSAICLVATTGTITALNTTNGYSYLDGQ